VSNLTTLPEIGFVRLSQIIGNPTAKAKPAPNLMDALRASLNSSDAKAAASKKTKAKPVAKRKAG
jgi:non-homologous end joining protein Ku